MRALPGSHTPLPHRVVRTHLGTMSWNPSAFASIVQARPLPIFGRPVRPRDRSLDYNPVVLLKPFRLHLAVDALPSKASASAREALPPRSDIDPGSRAEWDFNPPETCAARHTLLTPPTPTTAHRDFGLPYTRQLMPLRHHRGGSPALRCSSSTACHPCYPGRSQRPLPLSEPLSIGLPHLSTGSASSNSLTRLHLGSLALRPAALPIGNLRPPVARAPLP